ncbi:MAG TPA: PEGA domain-containing protein [Kofleriaceae bacterium]|nr:PEGA domain-containing protein [Kofleriaceae bacterium]
MLARRVIALCADKALARQIATALKAAGGAVDAHSSLAELAKGDLQAALVVIHLDGELATAAAELAPRLAGDSRVIAILPKADLPAVVDIMQSSERIAGILAAADFDARALAAMASRVLNGDIFGLEKLIPWGTQIHSQLVGDYQEKSLCIAQVSEFAEMMGVRRKYREAIEQCSDEMLMNALYDAPVDDAGKPIFSDIPTKTRISLRLEQKAVVQYACDGKQFAVSVRDAFGTLERATVLRYLAKCLHAQDPIDRKAGGAGLGLYLMTNSSSTLYFNVLPGVATEAVCVFDLESPKLSADRFGFFTEKIDAAGRLVAGPSRRLPAGASHPVERRHGGARPAAPPRGLVAALSLAIAAIVALIVVAAWPRLFGPAHVPVTFTTIPKGATIELDGKPEGATRDGALTVPGLEVGRAYPVVARADGYEPRQEVVQPHDGQNAVTIELVALAAKVELDSLPTGALVEIDGKLAGETPLVLTTLKPNTGVSIVLKKPGYHDAAVHLDVPGPGKELRVVEPLAVSADLARVRLVSEPPGARVIQNGQLLAGVVTPAEVLVEAGKPQRFTLELPHKVPAVLDPFVAAPGSDSVTKSAHLVDGSDVTFEANLEAKITVSAAPHCKELALPATCTLAPGDYIVELAGAASAHATRAIKVGSAPSDERFEFGYVEAGPGKLLHVGSGAGVRKAAFEPGSHAVIVSDDAGTHSATVRVIAGRTVNVD